MYQLYFDDPRSPTVANTRPKRFSFDPRILKQLNFLRSVDVASLSDSVSLFYTFFISTISYDNLMWLKKPISYFFYFHKIVINKFMKLFSSINRLINAWTILSYKFLKPICFGSGNKIGC